MSLSLFTNPTAVEAAMQTALMTLDPSRDQSAAFETFARTGLPHRRLEQWKWTDVRQTLREPPAGAGEATPIQSSPFVALDPVAVSVDSFGARATDGGLNGVSVRAYIDRAPEPLNLDRRFADHPMVALNRALAGRGVEIAVAPGAKLLRPILIRHFAHGGMQHMRVRVTVGEGAEATILESFEGEGDGFLNTALELDIERDAKVRRYLLQDMRGGAVVTSVAVVRLAHAVQYDQGGLAFGARLARFETFVTHAGKNAQATMTSASLLGGESHADFTSLVEHAAEDCTTRQVHKSAVRGKARAVFQGKFLVSRGAQKTDAQMRANGLLLSDKAEINAKPELEIYADDVQCAHGATAGQLDADALFYMRTRGIDEETAKAILVEAFLAEAFDGLEEARVAEVFKTHARAWLGGAQ